MIIVSLSVDRNVINSMINDEISGYNETVVDSILSYQFQQLGKASKFYFFFNSWDGGISKRSAIFLQIWFCM